MLQLNFQLKQIGARCWSRHSFFMGFSCYGSFFPSIPERNLKFNQIMTGNLQLHHTSLFCERREAPPQCSNILLFGDSSLVFQVYFQNTSAAFDYISRFMRCATPPENYAKSHYHGGGKQSCRLASKPVQACCSRASGNVHSQIIAFGGSTSYSFTAALSG